MNGVLGARHIAVVGASETSFFGRLLTENLLRSQCTVYPVNPRRFEVLGVKAYPSPEQLPAEVEQAVLVVGREQVRPQAEACCLLPNLKSIIVISSGFREAGNAAEEDDLISYCHDRGVRLVGPNSLGYVSFSDGICCFAAPMPWKPAVGHISLVMQSGGIASGVVRGCADRNLGIDCAITLGNARGYSVAAALLDTLERPTTTVVGCFVESFGEMQELRSALERARALNKRVVICKAGRTARGIRQAQSHTGALADEHRLVQAICEAYGAAMVDELEGLIGTLALFSVRPSPRPGKPVVISGSGGVATLAADLCEEYGIELAQFLPETRDRLKALLPDFGNVSNPLDTTAQLMNNPELKARFFEALAADPGVSVLVSFMGQGIPTTDSPSHLAALGHMDDTAAHSPLTVAVAAPVFHSFRDQLGPFLERSHVAFLVGLGESLKSVEAYLNAANSLAAGSPDPGAAAPPVADRIIRSLPAGPVNEHITKRYLAQFGLDVGANRLAVTPEEAATTARELGYPVVAKLVSHTVLHKARVSGVEVGLRDDRALLLAVTRLLALPYPKQGVLIDRMLSFTDEWVIGLERTAAGPVIMFGRGGGRVEEEADVTFSLCPVSAGQAKRLVERTRSGRRWAQSAAETSVDELCRVLSAVSWAPLVTPGLKSLDINPIVETGGQWVALDAAAILS